jgi:HK97 family phage major capsid protein
MSTDKTAIERQNELAQRYNGLVAEFNKLSTLENRSAGQEQRLDDLERAMSKIDIERGEIREERVEALRDMARNGELTYSPNVVPSSPEARTGGRRASSSTPELDAGHRAIDLNFRSKWIPDHAAEAASALLDQGHPVERSLAARWASAAGDPAYRTAFATLLADPTRGHLLWTPAEADAFRAVAAVQSEMRAMSTTAADGGAMIPLSLDPAIMLTSAGSNNELRRLATVKTTLTNAWTGVTSAGATAEWKPEADEMADGSPTLASPSIPMFLGDSFVPYSYEVGQDAVNFLAELTEVLVDAADNLMAEAYTTGDGTTAPQGIITGAVAGGSTVTSDGTEALVAADPYKLQSALPARFSANATFQSHIAIANVFRQMETSNGALQFPELRENPAALIGKPWFENSNMDGVINPAATANNYVAVYGDVRRGFFIVDRVGSTLEIIQNLVGANQRPTGQRGAVLWFRTGSKVVIPNALRVLNVPTTE